MGRSILLTVLLSTAAAAEFEVAAIHPSRRASAGVLAPTRVQTSIEYSANGVRFVNFSIRDLIQEAFQLAPRRVETNVQQLQRLLNQRFDISAQAAELSSRRILREMLQSLLASRFAFQFHREARAENVFRMITRGGGSLQPSTASKPNPHYQRRGDTVWYLDAPPASFADILTAYMGLRVIDATGLTGLYDFPMAKQASATEEGRDAVVDNLQKIGLDLVRSKADIEYLIVDRVEAPSEN